MQTGASAGARRSAWPPGYPRRYPGDHRVPIGFEGSDALVPCATPCPHVPAGVGLVRSRCAIGQVLTRPMCHRLRTLGPDQVAGGAGEGLRDGWWRGGRRRRGRRWWWWWEAGLTDGWAYSGTGDWVSVFKDR